MRITFLRFTACTHLKNIVSPANTWNNIFWMHSFFRPFCVLVLISFLSSSKWISYQFMVFYHSYACWCLYQYGLHFLEVATWKWLSFGGIPISSILRDNLSSSTVPVNFLFSCLSTMHNVLNWAKIFPLNSCFHPFVLGVYISCILERVSFVIIRIALAWQNANTSWEQSHFF